MTTACGSPLIAFSNKPGADQPTPFGLADTRPSETPLPESLHDSKVDNRGRLIAFLAMPPWLVSANLHLVTLLVLGSLTLTEEDTGNVLLVAETAFEVEEELLELAEVSIEPVVDPSLQISPLQPSVLDAGGQTTVEVGAPVDLDLNLTGMIARAKTTTDEILGLRPGDGMIGLGDSAGYESASFFGATAEGRRFVFVVDNSNSMVRGRFETVLDELTKTVNSLSAKQQFYVVFFSDAAYRMFHPEPTTEYLAATARNKERLRAWLYTVEMCFMTRGQESLQIALEMKPDAIYVLGDGAFTDGAASMITAPHNRRIPIHTIGMEVNWRGASQLQEIADANNGTYREVVADAQARLQAEQYPIKRNWSRGTVWGINLRR